MYKSECRLRVYKSECRLEWGTEEDLRKRGDVSGQWRVVEERAFHCESLRYEREILERGTGRV